MALEIKIGEILMVTADHGLVERHVLMNRGCYPTLRFFIKDKYVSAQDRGKDAYVVVNVGAKDGMTVDHFDVQLDEPRTREIAETEVTFRVTSD